MKDYVIHTRQDMVDMVEELGFLPFFAHRIPGYSIEEHCSPEVYFGKEPGVWEWKGPVIQETRSAYGKFFAKKAGFVSKKWFPDFANVRRDGYDFEARCEDGLASYNEQYLYKIISSRHSVLSKEAKAIGGYIKPRNVEKDSWEPRKGFETQITRLQMECYVLKSDFEYEVDKNGNFYGWGIARYAIPEEFYGKKFESNVYKRTPEESFARIFKHMKKILPDTPEEEIERLIRG